jgi:hypothetical protein
VDIKFICFIENVEVGGACLIKSESKTKYRYRKLGLFQFGPIEYIPWESCPKRSKSHALLGD